MKQRFNIYFLVLTISMMSLFSSPLNKNHFDFNLNFNNEWNQVNTFLPTALNKVKGNVTERMSDYYFQNLTKQRTGGTWRKVNATNTSQGIDHFFLKYNKGKIIDCLIADSKYNTSRLSKPSGVRQLSYNWNKRTISTQALPVVDAFIENIRKDEVTIAHPLLDVPLQGNKHYIDEKNYLWTDYNDRVHYTGKKSELVSTFDSHVIKSLKNQKKYYGEIVEGRTTPKLRIVQYNVENNKVNQLIKEVQYDSINNNEVIINRIIGSKQKSIDTFMNEMDESDFINIREKCNFSKKIQLREFKENLSPSDLELILSNKKDKISQRKILDIKKRFNSMDFKKNCIIPSVKGISQLAFFSSAFVFCNDALTGSKMHWTQDVEQSLRCTVVGASYPIMDTMIRRCISKKLLLSFKYLGYALPGVGDFIVSEALDEFYLRKGNYSINTKKLIRERDLKINGISSIAGVSMLCLTSGLGPVGVIIGASTDILLNIILENTISQPNSTEHNSLDLDFFKSIYSNSINKTIEFKNVVERKAKTFSISKFINSI